MNSELPQHLTPIYIKLHLERGCVYHMPPFKELLTKQNMLFFIIMAPISVINKLALPFSKKNMELPLLHSDYLFLSMLYIRHKCPHEFPTCRSLNTISFYLKAPDFLKPGSDLNRLCDSINYWRAKMKARSILHHYLWTRALFLERWGVFYSEECFTAQVQPS